jgi:PadR family transcriptional regulator, regulatory protein PadR
MYSSVVITRELVAASSRPLVLSILGEGPSYGYAIIQRVRDLSEEALEWSDGMLYPVLHRLEREGLVQAYWEKPEGGHERKYYRLTDSGKRARKEEQQEWIKVHNTLAKLWKIKPVSI